MRKLFASVCATALLALGAASAAGAQQEADGLVVVQIENVLNNNDVNVVVPISVAAAIAANVCGVQVPIAVLGGVDAGGSDFEATCTSQARAFNTGDLTISNN